MYGYYLHVTLSNKILVSAGQVEGSYSRPFDLHDLQPDMHSLHAQLEQQLQTQPPARKQLFHGEHTPLALMMENTIHMSNTCANLTAAYKDLLCLISVQTPLLLHLLGTLGLLVLLLLLQSHRL